MCVLCILYTAYGVGVVLEVDDGGSPKSRSTEPNGNWPLQSPNLNPWLS